MFLNYRPFRSVVRLLLPKSAPQTQTGTFPSISNGGGVALSPFVLTRSLERHRSIPAIPSLGDLLRRFIAFWLTLRMATTTDVTETSSELQSESSGTSSGKIMRRRRKRRNPIKRLAKRLKHRWVAILIVVLLVVLIPTAVAASFVTDTIVKVSESYSSLQRVLNSMNTKSLASITSDDFNTLSFAITDFSDTLRYANINTAFLRPIQNRIYMAPLLFQILDTLTQSVSGARDMMAGSEPAVKFLLQGEQNSSAVSQLTTSERLTELLTLGQSRFISAKTSLNNAKTLQAKLDLSSASPDLVFQLQSLGQYTDQLIVLDDILNNAPTTLSKAFGLDNAQSYLILSANSDELRPSGGYISTYGWLQVRRAHITDYGYSPTDLTSPNPAPTLPDGVNPPAWWIQYRTLPASIVWDGSWYADYPTTAKLASDFYDQGDNPRAPVDGVIGIDIVGFEYILQGLGNVTVPDYNQVVTPDNFRQLIYQIREQGDGDVPHKKFLAAIYQQILTDWQNASQKNNVDLFASTLKALQEKHIMLYFKDNTLNQAVHLLGWDGAQKPSSDYDYLMVADANVGGSKSNSSIARELTYSVKINDDGTLTSSAAVAYDFSAQVAANDPGVNPRNYNDINYFNTMQVYVPLGSKLTEAKNLPSPTDPSIWDNSDLKFTDFIASTQINFDSTERYEFNYTNPTKIKQYGPYYRYQLLLQKQPGMVGEPVDVQVTLPKGMTLVSATPLPIGSYSIGQAILEFHTTLTTDQWVTITYKVATP